MRVKTTAALGAALIIVGVSAIPAAAVGASFSWDGGAADDNWSSATNWDTDTVPGTDDTLVFSTATTTVNDMGAGYVVRALDIDNPNFDLSGDSIVVNLQIATYDDAIIRTDLTAAASQPWFADTGATLTLTGTANVVGASILDFQSRGNTVLDGPLNGPGTVLKSEDGILFLNGGGNTPGLDITAGGVHVNSVFTTTDVLLTGGTLSGGTPGNDLGVQQAIGELDASGGIVAPGPAALGVGLGTMYLGGTFTGSPGATLQLEFEGSASDTIVGVGVFDANNTQLDLTVGTAPAIGDEFVIVESTDTTANSFFTAVGGGVLADGAVVAATGHFFRIDYRTVDITLTYLGTTNPDTAGQLPPTGTDLTAPLGTVGALAVLGVALLFIARRRTA